MKKNLTITKKIERIENVKRAALIARLINKGAVNADFSGINSIHEVTYHKQGPWKKYAGHFCRESTLEVEISDSCGDISVNISSIFTGWTDNGQLISFKAYVFCGVEIEDDFIMLKPETTDNYNIRWYTFVVFAKID